MRQHNIWCVSAFCVKMCAGQYFITQGVPRGMDKTSGECFLC